MQVLWILFAISLLVLCAVLLVLEIFIPSLGLLTIFALFCLGGALVIFFNISATAGWIGVWTAVVLIPAVWIIVYKLFPKTSIGRALELKNVEAAVSGVPNQKQLNSLVGQTGTVLKPLRPVGICGFGKEKIVCVSETGYIDTQTHVKAIQVEGNKVIVRKIDNE